MSLLSRLWSGRNISRRWLWSDRSWNLLLLRHLNFTVRLRHLYPKSSLLKICGKKLGSSSTFLLGADQRLSGEGVFNGIYYCSLGFRAPYTCIPLCMRLVILMFWLRALIHRQPKLNIRELLNYRDLYGNTTDLRKMAQSNIVFSIKSTYPVTTCIIRHLSAFAADSKRFRRVSVIWDSTVKCNERTNSISAMPEARNGINPLKSTLVSQFLHRIKVEMHIYPASATPTQLKPYHVC